MTPPNRDLALLIDADNAQLKYLPAIMKTLERYGNPIIRRAYGDWAKQELSNWRNPMLEHAIKPMQQLRYTATKDATDMALLIDAMDILHTGEVQGFVIVSSNSDFTPLCIRLREDSLFVVGIGRKNAPKALTNACNEFVHYGALDTASKKRKRPSRSARGSSQKAAAQPAQTASPDVAAQADDIPAEETDIAADASETNTNNNPAGRVRNILSRSLNLLPFNNADAPAQPADSDAPPLPFDSIPPSRFGSGSSRFGSSKPANDKKDDKQQAPSRFGSGSSRFGGKSNDDKKDDKQQSSASRFGGSKSSRFGDKPNNDKKDDKQQTSSRFRSRFDSSKPADDKKQADTTTGKTSTPKPSHSERSASGYTYYDDSDEYGLYDDMDAAKAETRGNKTDQAPTPISRFGSAEKSEKPSSSFPISNKDATAKPDATASKQADAVSRLSNETTKPTIAKPDPKTAKPDIQIVDVLDHDDDFYDDFDDGEYFDEVVALPAMPDEIIKPEAQSTKPATPKAETSPAATKPAAEEKPKQAAKSAQSANTKQATKPKQSAKPQKKANKPKATPKPDKAEPVVTMLRDAFESIANGREWVSLSTVGKALHTQNDNFDVKNFGHKSLSGLIKSHPTVFEVRLKNKKHPSSIQVKLKK